MYHVLRDRDLEARLCIAKRTGRSAEPVSTMGLIWEK